MADLAKALATQMANIESKTGKSREQLVNLVKSSGLTKHGEIRDMLKLKLGLGHGDANTLTHMALQSDGASAAAAANLSTDQVLDGIYTGPKESLRPIHEALMKEIKRFGEFEIAPKKTYVSLRRKKQFAMIGPATNTRVEVGLNMKGVDSTDRLEALPPKGMCDFRVKVTGVDQVDKELIAWIKRAFDASA